METKWNVLVWSSWALLFFAIEIPAIFRVVPWDPLSVVIWDLQHFWIVTVLVTVLCLWLLFHLVLHFTI